MGTKIRLLTVLFFIIAITQVAIGQIGANTSITQSLGEIVESTPKSFFGNQYADVIQTMIICTAIGYIILLVRNIVHKDRLEEWNKIKNTDKLIIALFMGVLSYSLLLLVIFSCLVVVVSFKSFVTIPKGITIDSLYYAALNLLVGYSPFVLIDKIQKKKDQISPAQELNAYIRICVFLTLLLCFGEMIVAILAFIIATILEHMNQSPILVFGVQAIAFIIGSLIVYRSTKKKYNTWLR